MDTVPRPTTRAIAEALERRGVPFRVIGEGRALVTLDCARLLSVSLDEGAPNLLWTHPDLVGGTTALADLVGGAGGIRLWIGPETSYFWDGIPEWEGFSNYRKQAAIDPGNYSFDPAADGATLSASMSLRNYRDGAAPRITVRRTAEVAEPPAADGCRSVAVTLTDSISFDDAGDPACVDLWQVLQVTPGSELLVPLSTPESPLAYGPRGHWRNERHRVTWSFTGTESAKLGISASAATGRAGSINRTSDEATELIVWDFEVGHPGEYVDHPYGIPRDDQVFQAWDGFGFGELEVRSRGVDGVRARHLQMRGLISVYVGPADAIASVSQGLLGLTL